MSCQGLRSIQQCSTPCSLFPLQHGHQDVDLIVTLLDLQASQ